MEDTLGQDLNNLLFKDILFKDMWGNETKGQVISIGIDERDGYVQVNVNTGYPENMISKDNIIEVLTEAAQTVESDDKLFTKSQIMDELKRETDNFTIPEDTYRYCFEEEAEYAKEVLMRKGYECDLGYDDSNWVTVHFYKSNDMNESYSKTYQITVKYHNEPNAKIEARSAKDRKDLEYQLNIDDEVEWYDFDEKQFNESIDQMREKALKMKDNSNAFAILYGYKVKDKEVELEPEEFATEEEYKERIQQITNSFTKLSDKDPRGNRYGHEHNIEFYTVYPNKKQVSESTAINNNWKVKKSRIDTKKIDSIINNLISSFPIIGSKPATIFKRHYKEKFVRYDIWLGYAVPGDAEAVEQKLIPSFEYLRDAVAPYGWKAFFEFSGYVGTDFFIQIRMPYETLENVAPNVVTESVSYSDKNTNKWNIGSDKSKLSNEEIALLDELAQKLESSSVNGYKYVVQHTYEDFGAGMQWYTIVCYDKKGDSWQVLDTKEWLQLMNTGDVDAVYSEVISGEYFQDKLEKAILDEMNHRQLMSYMDNLD